MNEQKEIDVTDSQSLKTVKICTVKQKNSKATYRTGEPQNKIAEL